VGIFKLAHGATLTNHNQNLMSVLPWVLRACQTTDIQVVATDEHTANTPAATFPMSSDPSPQVSDKIKSWNRSLLTMNATSVSGFNPFFNTGKPIDPMKPSKFSRKKPGWSILFAQPGQFQRQVTPLTDDSRPIQSFFAKFFAMVLDVSFCFVR
jgi:hypothetical protein